MGFLEGKVLKVHKSGFSTDVTIGRVSNLFVLYREKGRGTAEGRPSPLQGRKAQTKGWLGLYHTGRARNRGNIPKKVHAIMP